MEPLVDPHPFTDQLLDEVRLQSAPLVGVFCQVRWPQVTSIPTDLEPLAIALGKVLARDYPISERHNEVQLQVSPQGVRQIEGEGIHQWTSVDGSWIITFARSFLTIQAKKYTDRDDFISRFNQALEALKSVVDIPVIDRIGIRYINRIVDPTLLNELPSLVKSQILGGRGVDFKKATMMHTMTEVRYSVGDSRLLVRSAQLPSGGTTDPSVEPVSQESWVLDLDASYESRMPFDPETTSNKARELSALAYNFFRWAVNNDFLERFEKE